MDPSHKVTITITGTYPHGQNQHISVVINGDGTVSHMLSSFRAAMVAAGFHYDTVEESIPHDDYVRNEPDIQLPQAEPKWVVNDIGELGVFVNGQYYFLYKGESLQYETGLHDNGLPMYVRPVGKREFGEVCWPYEAIIDGTLQAPYTKGDGWVTLPPSKKEVE